MPHERPASAGPTVAMIAVPEESDFEPGEGGEKMCQQSPATPLLADTESSTSAPGTLGAAFDIAPYDGAQASTNWRKTSGEWQPGRSTQEQTVVRRCVDQ